MHFVHGKLLLRHALLEKTFCIGSSRCIGHHKHVVFSMYIAFIYISKNLHLSAEDLFKEGTLPSFQQTLDLSNATIA